jgi:PEP-CTERM/exosortase A-associated glycosyltransferase
VNRRLRRILSAARHPRRTWRRLRARGIALLLPTLARLPRPLRRRLPAVAGAIGVVQRLLPGLGLLPQLIVVLRWAGGDRETAARVAATAGTSPRTASGARRRLVPLLWDLGRHDVAKDILTTLPDDHAPVLEVIRARVAFDAGRYHDVLAMATAEGVRERADAAALAERTRGHLAILEPAWRPSTGREGRQLAARWHGGTPGRILHLVTVSVPYRLAGYTVRTQSVVRSQRAVGLDAHVATRAGFPFKDGFPKARLDEVVDGVPYHRLVRDLGAVARPDQTIEKAARAAAALVDQLRPAALQPASNHVQARIALAVGRPIGLPVVYEVRGFWEESWAAGQGLDPETAWTVDRYRGSREAEGAVVEAADAIITLSETMRAELIARGCAPDKITVVPNAVETDRFVPRPRDEALAARHGIGPDDQVVGYITTFNAYEGIPILLQAAARLRDGGRPVKVLLVGDGDEERTIRAEAARLGLDDGTLVMPGRVGHDDIQGYYGLIDVFVVPRTPDRVSRLVTPLKPLEAMALERTVVVSDVPALRELVIPDQTGRTFTAGDPDDLARVLDDLLVDPEARETLGRQAREWVGRERTWAQNGQRYRELYERLGVV